MRHGQTVWHGQNRYAGSSDIALDERGYAQAELLGTWAASAGLSAIYASPLTRARATAAPAAAATGLAVHIDARLRELHFGHGEGLTSAEMVVAFPQARAAFEVDPVANPLPGGEQPLAAAQRAAECLREIAAAHRHRRLLVVAHSTLIRLTLCLLLGLALPRYREVLPFLSNGAVTEISLDGERAGLLTFNTPLTSSSGSQASTPSDRE